MEKLTKEKKGNPIPVRFKPSTEEALRKVSVEEDRSFGYIVERAVRRDLGLDENNVTLADNL